ncbi:MAG: hypothetical protein M0Z75_13695 [Nitrospiraceae bacterium]|nr:hypothetical protein [Nitrospiraceae bacterium]
MIDNHPHEDDSLKYLEDLADDLSAYISAVILNVFHGVVRNLGIPDPENMAVKPPEQLSKGILSGLVDKIRGYIGKHLHPKPFTVRGMNLYKKGRPMTQSQWDKFEDQVVQYMRPYLNGVNEEMAVKGVLLALASAEAENQQKRVHEYGKKSYEQVEHEVGPLPRTFSEASSHRRVNKEIEKTITRAYAGAAQYVQGVKDDVREAIRQQVVKADKLGLTPQELASNLYWMKDENPDLKQYTAQALLRDWRRVANTELAMIHEQGKMAAYEDQAMHSMRDQSKAVYMIFTGGTCPWCQAHQGRVARLIPMEMVGGEDDDSLSSRGIKDPHTDIAVWQGKNNVGYRQAQWRLCTPAHPWNKAHLVRFHPEAESYNEDTGRIEYKNTKDMEQYLPDDFKRELDEERERIRQREDQQEADRTAGVHKRDIEYIDRSGTPAGTDRGGRPLATVNGTLYVGVPAEDFGAELEAWRRDRTRPIPVAENQREYSQIFR